MANSITQTKKLIQTLSEGEGVSGYEYSVAPLVKEIFAPLADQVDLDRFGNLYALKKGTEGRHKIMLAAHMDEIGLIVTDIDKRGFIRFSGIGGVDQRTLLAQEVIIHGRRPVLGIIGTMPPHLIQPEDEEKAVKMENMGIDTGFSADNLKELVQIGDVITLRRNCYDLLNDLVAGKAFDDRAGVAVMAVCLKELSNLRHAHDVVAVATTQEEVGVRGAITSAYTLNPDLAVAIDVTHAATPDTKGQVSIELGKGPAIALGPNIHPAIYDHFTQAAKEHRLPSQPEPCPGSTGTDAWAIQVSQAGVPTGLLSIPLRYMHTSVETIDLQDVVNTGKLLAHFIADLPDDLEGFICF